MKKHLLLLITAVFLSFSAIAQTDVSGTLANNATWTPSGSPYTVTGNITVNDGVTLTIESGTVVQFNSNTYIQVYGTLNATGVTFTANGSTTPGFWQGLYVGYEWGSSRGTISLNGCTVEYARSVYVRMGDLFLSNNTLLNNFSSYGINIYTAGDVDIESTSVKNCLYPVYFGGDGGWNTGAGVDLTGNTNDYVFINFRDINSEFTCSEVGIPYYYDSELRVASTGALVVDAGVELLGNTNAFMTVHGKLKLNGTATDSVTLGRVPTSDYWRGIRFYDSAVDTACYMNYTKIIDVKRAYYDDGDNAVYIEKSSPVFSNCTFTNNHYNLEVSGRSLPVFNNCYFDESTVVSYKIKNINIDLTSEPAFNNCDIAFNEQEGRAVGIYGSTVYDDSHVRQISFNGFENLTYVLNGDVVIQDTASLTIDPGIVIKCSNSSYNIYAHGKLEGIGTETAPIVFTHINDDNYGNPADTYNNGTAAVNHTSSGRIVTYTNSASHLKYWKILYAGRTTSSGYYALNLGGDCILENSTIMYSDKGVLFSGDAQLLNNTFDEIDRYPVARYFNGGSPSLIGNTIGNVGYNGILVHGFATGTYSIGGMDFAGNTNVAYIVQDENRDIPEGAYVTILPGTVFKFNGYWSSKITVRGGLKAEGTATNKIIFTSVYDNSVAGNTNFSSGEDPVNNKYTKLTFAATSDDTFNSLKNVEFRYLRESVTFDNCIAAVDSVIINFSDSYGLAIFGDAAPVISNSQFNNIKYAPVQMDMFSAPVFSGNSMANVGYAALSIRGTTVSGTVPVRNFAGYNNITYVLDGNLRVDDELTVPAGVVFKASSNRCIDVYGKLNINGTATEPVVFTSLSDDAYGNPNDTEVNGSGSVTANGPRVIFRSTSDVTSVVDNAIFRYSYYNGVRMYDASPTVSNCTFQYNKNDGIVITGRSAPVITNCTFDNVPFPLTIAPPAFPASVSGNVLSGTTAKAILIYDNSTLTEDATLPKIDFAGVTAIPYMFYHYTIGTSAVLTIEPGVVCKFMQGGYLTVRKGLIADGGSTVDSTIVFTSDRDDFYGGDTYGDGDANTANIYWWRGIYFSGESLDAECMLDNCVIKNATYTSSNSASLYNKGAVTVDNASPTITNTRFEDDKWGLIVRNTSLPVINNCDFIGMDPTYGYGIWNETGSVVVTAENCWWDDDTGPYNATSNPSGEGVRVSDNVDFDPWITQPSQPVMGDVSLNGEVMPYDASLVLQSSVGNITLSSQQLEVADVSFNGSVTSYDASLILQYTTGLITSFEPSSGAAQLKSTGIVPDVTVTVPYDRLEPETASFELPVEFTSGESVKSMDIEITTDPGHLVFKGLDTGDIPSDVMSVSGYDESTGTVKISLASAYDLALNGSTLSLMFEIKDAGVAESNVELVNLSANETSDDDHFIVVIGSNQLVTGINDKATASSVKVYASDRRCYADMKTANVQSQIIISVFDLTGQKTNEIIYRNVPAGQQRFSFTPDASGTSRTSGMYIITVRGDDFAVTSKVVVK
jgi:parallel beta-helix repeat protein